MERTHRSLLVFAALAGLSCGEAAGPDPESVQCDVRLYPGGDPVRIEQLTVTPCPADLSDGEVTVLFRIRARAPASQISVATVASESDTPAPFTPQCRSREPTTGTLQDGTWECRWVLNTFAEAGSWTVRAAVYDTASTLDTARVTLTVLNADLDTEAPVLREIEHADSVTTTPWGRTQHLILWSSDSEVGVWRADVGGYYAASEDRGGYDWSCSAEFGKWPPAPLPLPDVWRAEHEFGFVCPWGVVESDTPVIWLIDAVTVSDLRGNERTYDRAALEAGGFLTEFDVARRP